MQFSDDDPLDFPAPPTADSITAEHGVPLFTFAPQPALEESGAGTLGSSRDGGPVQLEYASLSYTLWRNPDDHDDPVNLVELPESTRRVLETPPVRPIPAWMEEARRRMRHPQLWEAVRTAPVRPAGDPLAPDVESALLEHAGHILMNTFREERTDGRMPTTLIDPPTAADLDESVLEIDGVRVDGLALAADPHVHAVGARVGDRILTSVVPRAELEHLRVAFVTR